MQRLPGFLRYRQIANSDLNDECSCEGVPRRSVKYWLKALERLSEHSTPLGLPRYGYLLENDGILVGVIILLIF